MGCGASSINTTTVGATPAQASEERVVKNSAAPAATNVPTLEYDLKSSAPYLRYGGPCMTEDTARYLQSLTNYPFAQKCSKLLKEGNDFQFFELKTKNEKEVYAISFAEVVGMMMEKFASVGEEESLIWRMRLLSVFLVVNWSYFGDYAFKHLKKHLDDKFSIKLEEPRVENNRNFKKAEECKLSVHNHDLEKYMEKEEDDHVILAKEGEAVTKTEKLGIQSAYKYAVRKKDEIFGDLEVFFTEMDSKPKFYDNIKQMPRIISKMNEYAKSKPFPSFDHILDILRCKVVFSTPEDLESAYEQLKAKKYKIIQLKDKLSSDLKNITLNIVCYEIIVEIQLVVDTPVKSNVDGHRIYELTRCENIKNIIEVIIGLGDIPYDNFKPLKSVILPLKNTNGNTLMYFVNDESLQVHKSQEYGVNIEDGERLQFYEDDLHYILQDVQHLVYQYNDDNILGISLVNNYRLVPMPPNETDSFVEEHHVLTAEKAIETITGTYDHTGLKTMVLKLYNGDEINIGKTEGKTSFNLKVPYVQTYRVLGFYYTCTGLNKTRGILRLGCYFAGIEKPLETDAGYIDKPQPQFSVPVGCKECFHELTWSFMRREVNAKCNDCSELIDGRDGYLQCDRGLHLYLKCSDCALKDLKNMRRPANVNKLTCEKNGKEFKATINKKTDKTSKPVKCLECQRKVIKYFSCNCEDDEIYCLSCFYEKKFKYSAPRSTYSYPIVSTTQPCGRCEKGLLLWTYNLSAISTSFEGQCSKCKYELPCSSGKNEGGYYCSETECYSTICSKCFIVEEKTDVFSMPYFGNDKSKSIWNYDATQSFQCKNCKKSKQYGFIDGASKDLKSGLCASCYHESFQTAEAYYSKATTNKKNENHEEALELYTKATDKAPKNANYWNDRGYCCFKLEKFEDAVVSYGKAASLVPDEAIYWNNKGSAQIGSNDYQGAVESFKEATRLVDNSVPYWLGLARSYSGLKKYVEAVKVMETAIALEPENALYWNEKGDTQYNGDMFEDALQSYEKAIELDGSKTVLYWENKALAQSRLKKYADAVKSYDKVISFEPENAKYWNDRGDAQYNGEMYKDALESYEKAIEYDNADPETVLYWSNKALTQSKLEQYADAIESYNKVTSLEPENPVHWNNKGTAQYNNKDYADALESYEEAVKLKPEDETYKSNRDTAASMINNE